MEFVCDKKIIQEGVSAVEKIVATRSTLPIIGNILFESQRGGVKLSANNLEMGVELGIDASVSKEGAVLLPAKTLAEIVSKLPDGKVSFKLTENGIVRISYNHSYFNIHSLPPDEFPMLPKVKGGKSFLVDVEDFTSLVDQVSFAVSTSEDKYVLTGVLLEVGKSSVSGDNSNLRVVATDGYRLAKSGRKIDLSLAGEIKAVVPVRALRELSRILEGREGKLNVTVSPEQISFQLSGIYLVSRLIQGQFPDYRQVIPKKSLTKLVASTRGFLEAAERAAIVASGSANVTKFELKASRLHLVAQTPDVGSVDEVLEVEAKGAEKTQVSFNIRLIIDVLKVLKSEKVVVELSEALSPGVFRPEEETDFLYIVMPIRTQEVGG